LPEEEIRFFDKNLLTLVYPIWYNTCLTIVVYINAVTYGGLVRKRWHCTRGFESLSRTQGLPGWLSVESSLFFGLALYQAELFSQLTKAVTGFGFFIHG